MLCTPAFKAQGNIYPARFVNIYGSTANDFMVEETVSTAAEEQFSIIGISDIAGRDARSDVNDTRCAITGDPVKVYGIGDVCLLEMAATCNAGELLKSNGSTDGKGIPVVVTTAGGVQYYGAKALEHCSHSGQLIRVQVMFGQCTF